MSDWLHRLLFKQHCNLYDLANIAFCTAAVYRSILPIWAVVAVFVVVDRISAYQERVYKHERK